jgi:flagellar hook protein FlgE
LHLYHISLYGRKKIPMRLESALYSSSAGINVHGKAISVVGDNISNVSTYGFRKSRAEFADIFAEGNSVSSTIAEDTDGNGVRVNTVRPIHTSGTIEQTGRALDIAVDGNGFFLLGDPASPSYSRSGILQLNGEGKLVHSNGKSVLGYADVQTDENGTPTLGELGEITIDKAIATATPTANLTLQGNIDSTLPVVTIGEVPEKFTDLAKDASFTYSARVIDSLGVQQPVTFAFYKTGINEVTVQGYIDGERLGQEAGKPVKIGADSVINFDETGKIVEGSPSTITLNIPFTGGATPGSINVLLANFSQQASSSRVDSTTQDGKPAGQLSSIEVTKDGTISGIFDNGENVSLGSIALADFVNVDGLIREGDTEFFAGEETGARTVGLAQTLGLGSIQGGSLERSTVDIQTEFVDLVVFQRGYQANSQTFSATSTLLQQTIQLIR